MIYGLVMPGGVGDIIAVSAVARTMQHYGHKVFLHVFPERARIETAAHLDGFDGWMAIRAWDTSERGNQGVLDAGRCIAELLPSASVPDIRLGDCMQPGLSRVGVIAASVGFMAPWFLPPVWRVEPWEREMACKWLQRQFPTGDGPLVYLGNHALMNERALPSDRTVELCITLRDRGFRTVLNETTQGISKSLESLHNVVTADKLPFALRAAVIAESACCVSVDTGVVHMATALSVPLIGIFGPFTFQQVCGNYHRCYEAPVEKRAVCYGCNCMATRGHTEHCTTKGCKHVASVDAARTVAMVEELASSGSGTPSGVMVRRLGLSRLATQKTSLISQAVQTPIRRQADVEDAREVIVAGADGKMGDLALNLTAALRSMTPLPVVDLSDLVDWSLLVQPHWAKAWLWDILPDSVERLLYVDCDCFPIQMPEGLPRVALGAVEDLPETASLDRAKLPALHGCKRYFNSGVFVAERDATAGAFRAWQGCMFNREVGICADQGSFNIIMQNSGFEVHALPAGWNWLPAFQEPPESVFFAHFAGMPSFRNGMLLEFYNLHGSGRLPDSPSELAGLIRKKAAEETARWNAGSVAVDQQKESGAHVRVLEADRFELLSRLPRSAICAEVGTLRGDFAAAILAEARPNRLFLIDLWKHQASGVYDDKANEADDVQDSNYHQVLSRFGTQIQTGQIEIRRGLSTDELRKLPDGCLDWIYIDANHSYDSVLADLEAAKRVVKRNGLLLGHDYCEGDDMGRKFGVVRAVDAFLARNRDMAFAFVTADAYPTYVLAPCAHVGVLVESVERQGLSMRPHLATQPALAGQVEKGT